MASAVFETEAAATVLHFLHAEQNKEREVINYIETRFTYIVVIFFYILTEICL
jgi:hypothetical protein